MRLCFGLLTLTWLLTLTPARAAEDLETQVSEALKRYYNERLQRPFIITDDTPKQKVTPPPWTEPIKKLSSAKPEERQQAATYLRELLTQALQHEKSGNAPWRSTPYWGGGAEMPARELRKEIAEELAKANPVVEVLPILRWYLQSEHVDAFLEPVMKTLAKLNGKDADALRREIGGRPHDNVVVAAEAINQIAAGKGVLPEEVLARLCQHHRLLIREAARKLNTQQGGKDPGQFDAAKALRSEPVSKVMEQVLRLLPELPPKDAEFVKVSLRYLDDKKVAKESLEARGWLVSKKQDRVVIYTPYGNLETFHNGERKKIKHREPAPEGKGVLISKIDITTEFTVAAHSLEDLIREVENARKKGDASSELSERGPLTGQFRGSGATLYEAILGAWLYRAGRDAEAARVVLPALDSLYLDRHLADVVRQQIGEVQGYRMLVAFVGDRDYAQTLHYAQGIDKLYPGTRFSTYAKGFVEQLPRRKDDFTKLKLPTAAEWEELKKKLTRDQQIDFLCERMRLLNCFQMGQPGGYDPGETQYAEACGLAENASWGLGRGKTKVINPSSELEGHGNWFDDQKARPQGMKLTLKDVPILSKHLRDDWYMLIVSFWRDFHPDRHLASTRPHFAQIINGLARKDLCRIAEWSDYTPAKIDKEIERINAWAKGNADKTVAELDWASLQEDLASEVGWHAVEGRIEALLKEKQEKVYDVMKQFLEEKKIDDYSRSGILKLYWDHDVTRAKDLAPKYLDSKSEGLRHIAARIVFQTGEKGRAREILGESLANGNLDTDAVEMLLKEGSEASRKQVARLFTSRQLKHDQYGVRVAIFRLCLQAKMKEPYSFYLPLLEINKPELEELDDKGERTGVSFFQPTVAQAFAEEIVGRLVPEDPAIKEIVRKNPKTIDQIPHLKKWLQAQLDKPKN